MPVHQHILNWLYSVLTSEYHDVNRTYNDVAQTLTRYPSLAPRTDVHTFPDGTSALLLHLSGTIPVNFRGSTYRFPLSVWVPHAYPKQPPLVYVTPTDTMRVRPGQHVDPQGQVYHPYLVGWGEFWDKSTLFDFLAILSDVFAKEPPVVSRQQAVQSPPPQQHVPPPVPPLPPQVSERPASQAQNRPPPPSPKTYHGEHERGSISSLSPPPTQPSPAQRPSRYDSAPPLPPQVQAQSQTPIPRPQSQSQSPQQHFGYQYNAPPSRHGYSASVQPSTGLPPPPPPPQQQQHQQQHQQQYQRQQQHPAPDYKPGPPAQTVYRQWDPAQAQAQAQAQVRQPPGPWNPATQQQPAPPSVQVPPPPPPDLLDEPLTLDLPTQAVAPPPIPPNPEKDALLVQLAQTLASLRQQNRQQNESSMAGLQAQRHAMLSVLPTIQSEMSQLTQLSNVLSSNATILHQATVKADAVIDGSSSHPAPDIDELLVAPTVVSNQLYALVAEERALGDAIFMLGRAVEKGRIPPAVFAKMTRSLAREWYLKKALVRKIGIGMGLSAP